MEDVPWRDTFRAAAWRIAALALAPALGLGIGRFAYALVLPDMRADLGWSFVEAGAMNAVNAAGYLTGAVLAAPAIRRFGATPVLVCGVATCLLTLFASGLVRTFPVLGLTRAGAGVGGAFAFIAGGVLATGIAGRHGRRASFLIGLFYGGAGIGILLSGLVTPFLLAKLGAGSWPAAWLVFGALALPMAAAVGLAAPRGQVGGANAAEPVRTGAMTAFLLAYTLFGAGYIAYMTFMLAFVQETGAGPGLQAAFWATIGIATMASPWLWAGVLRTGLHGRAFAILTAVTALGAALPLARGGLATLIVSAAVFGCAFFSVVASTTAFVRRNYAPGAWPSAIGRLTIAFSLGQTVGPVAVGAVTDAWRGLSAGLWTSVGLLVAAVAAALAQRDLRASGDRV
ncbi:MAG: YbfB/YjiJ family MFS transporter [Methylobacteriaceae bacterium]|nr:YbfB/YjiJ family MFS transporter [Methylobacteriaceae bacterium]